MNNQNREDYVDFNEQEYETEGFEDQGAEDYQDPGYDDPGLADDAAYEDEDFPEPGQAPAAGEKKKLSPAMMAGAGALVLTLVVGAGYYFTMGDESGGMPDIMAMITGESSGGGEVPADAPPEGETVPVEDEAAPPPKPAKPAKPAGKPAAKPDDGWKEPVKVDKKTPPKPVEKPKPKPAVAAKPKPVAKKPAAVAAKPPAPKPKPIAAKPRPAAVAAAGAKPAGASAHTSVAFAAGSYWVASADMEKLWSFSSALKTNAGRITVEAHPGSEPNAADLTRKRADRVAELLRKNNVGSRFDVNVKIGKGAPGTGRVDVYYSRQL